MDRIKTGDIVRVNTPEGYIWGQINGNTSDPIYGTKFTWWYVMPVGQTQEIEAHSDSILVLYRPSEGERWS